MEPETIDVFVVFVALHPVVLSYLPFKSSPSALHPGRTTAAEYVGPMEQSLIANSDQKKG